MPDRRRHRGRHPQDDALFSPSCLEGLSAAAHDFAWLLSHGYVAPSALKLVGDRYGLRERQRLAVLRSTCSDAARLARRRREVDPAALAGRTVWIDGYNVLITVEAALAGGVLLLGRDGCLRDLASLHGTFRQVEETRPALEAIGRWLSRHGLRSVTLLLDRPVSNSGRLAESIRTLAEERGWPWIVELEASCDGRLARAADVVATSDSVVLDRCAAWVNLARHVVASELPATSVIDLSVI